MESMKEENDDEDNDKKPDANNIDDDGGGTEKKKKKRKKKEQNQKCPPTCNVIAPETMAGGTKFETDVDGIKFIVKVPDGGVTKGSTLTVPYPSSSSSSSSSSSKPKSASSLQSKSSSSSKSKTKSKSNNNNSKISSASASAIQIPSVQATLVIPEEEFPMASTSAIPTYPTTSFTHTNTSSSNSHSHSHTINSNSQTSATATAKNNPPVAAAAVTIRVMAPDTLIAGSTFEAQMNMNLFMVTVPYGGVTKGEMFEVPYPTSFTTNTNSAAANHYHPVPIPIPIPVTETETVQVVAPSTMNGSQMFEAHVDGIKFMVTVPENGINQGELFTVPYPTTTTTTTTTIGGESPRSLSTGPTANNNYNDNNNDTTNVVNAYGIPTTDGRWRTDICDCCPAGNCSLCCMGFWCTPILMGQLMQRMKYNLCGVPVQPNGTGYKCVCMVISITTIFLFIPVSILYVILPSLSFVLIYGWFIYLIIIFTCTRCSMRREYNIKSLCCNNGDANDDCCGGMEDFCIVYWCSCCSAIQMIAHTHDGRQYPYNPCNQTGLDMYAPDIHIV
jgi:Cys-rich protein (TIGR01571 family)